VHAADNLTWGQKRFIFTAAMLSQAPEHVVKAASALPSQEEWRKKRKKDLKKKNQ